VGDGEDARVISFPLAGEFAPNAHNLAAIGDERAPLLVFLPATRAVPASYSAFLAVAHDLGYSVLALDFFNRGLSLVKTCAGIPDCYGTVQRNRFDGSSPSAWSAVAPSNSIMARLHAALDQLDAMEPEAGWARFAPNGAVDWRSVVVAGHSQGGGQAAFIAHEHPVRAVLMFSAPAQTDDGVPASWLAEPGATPPDRMSGFISRGDVYFDNVMSTWRALGLAGTSRIVTDVALGTPGESHSRSVNDSTPRDGSGVPLFVREWTAMLQDPLRLS
jgi:pimeloyl-ACP methyl ester carboxylesterase